MKYKIELINIGRNNFSDIIIKDFSKLSLAEGYAYKICDSKLMSRDTYLSKDKNDKITYTLFAGFRNVGEVRIIIQEELSGVEEEDD